MLLPRHTFFLNEGSYHWFQRAKGSIIIFFALHLASVLIDWTSWTLFYPMCLPEQFWGQIFYLMAQHVENLTFQLLYISDAPSEIHKQTSGNLSVAHLGNTYTDTRTHTLMHIHTPSQICWAKKANAYLGGNLNKKLCLQEDFILEMFC